MTLPSQKKYAWTPNGMEDHPHGAYMLHDTHFRDEVLTLRATLLEQRYRLDKAETALKIAGYTLKDGAEAWKPPLGPSMSPRFLEKLDQQTQTIIHLQELHTRYYDDRTRLTEQLTTAQATVKDLERRLCIEKILNHSQYGLRRPMTPSTEPLTTQSLIRVSEIVARLHAIEREKIHLERELRDLKLTESKTLLTES